MINFNVGDHNTLTVNEPVAFIQSLPGGQPRIEGFGINIHFTHGVENHPLAIYVSYIHNFLFVFMLRLKFPSVPYAQGPHESEFLFVAFYLFFL